MGIAKVKQAAEATITLVNKSPGTFPYMAPEMLSPVDVGQLYTYLFSWVPIY